MAPPSFLRPTLPHCPGFQRHGPSGGLRAVGPVDRWGGTVRGESRRPSGGGPRGPRGRRGRGESGWIGFLYVVVSAQSEHGPRARVNAPRDPRDEHDAHRTQNPPESAEVKRVTIEIKGVVGPQGVSGCVCSGTVLPLTLPHRSQLPAERSGSLRRGGAGSKGGRESWAPLA